MTATIHSCFEQSPIQANCQDVDCPAFGQKTASPYLQEVICRRSLLDESQNRYVQEAKRDRINPIIETVPRRGCVL